MAKPSKAGLERDASALAFTLCSVAVMSIGFVEIPRYMLLVAALAVSIHAGLNYVCAAVSMERRESDRTNLIHFLILQHYVPRLAQDPSSDVSPPATPGSRWPHHATAISEDVQSERDNDALDAYLDAGRNLDIFLYAVGIIVYYMALILIAFLLSRPFA